MTALGEALLAPGDSLVTVSDEARMTAVWMDVKEAVDPGE